MISRRQMLVLAGAAPFLSALESSAETQGTAQTAQVPAASKGYPRMGGTPTAFVARMMASKGSPASFDMIEHCHSIGLAGVQTNPPSIDPGAIRQFRQRLEKYNMHLVCDPRLPVQESDVGAFDAQVKAYKEAGAAAFHAALTDGATRTSIAWNLSGRCSNDASSRWSLQSRCCANIRSSSASKTTKAGAPVSRVRG